MPMLDLVPKLTVPLTAQLWASAIALDNQHREDTVCNVMERGMVVPLS